MTHASSKKIGVLQATIVGINAMIGAGIFSAPAKLGSAVGPAGVITYLLTITAICFLAFSFARLASLFPQEGSFYLYAQQWGGHTAGMIAIVSYLIGLCASMGLVAKLAGLYLHDYISIISPKLISFAILALLTLLNIIGGSASRASQLITIISTASPIIIITILCLSRASLVNLQPFAPHGVGAIFRTTAALVFSFFGFESTVSLYNVVQNPQKNVGRALRNAIVTVGLIYFMFLFSIMLALPSTYFLSPATKLTTPLAQLFPHYLWLITIVHVSIISSFIGVLNAVILATSSLLISVANKAQSKFIAALVQSGFINRKVAAVVMGILIAINLLLLHEIDLFFNVAAIFILSAFVMALLALLTVPQERKGWRFVQTIISIITACIILGFAVQGIVAYATVS